MTGDTLPDTLAGALAACPEGPVCVAFSGGPDSTALLHALASLPVARKRGLRAVHVDHGLQSQSRQWAAHCSAFCERLGVALAIRRVQVDRLGRGIEAAAREARYAAFESMLQSGEILVTAHHHDDQAETVLLKLLRGSGPEGLGGMRAWRRLGAGWLWRPLLDTPRTALAGYLLAHGLPSVDDPSNHSRTPARNFLRHEILPRLATHWPRASRAIAHSARLNRQCDDYIHEAALEALEALRQRPGEPLPARGWYALHPALRGPVLDEWLHEQFLPGPGLPHREQLERQIGEAAADRIPLVRWPGAAIHIWRGRLHAHAPLPDLPDGWRSPWNGEPLLLPGGRVLALEDAARRNPQSCPPLLVTLGETGVRLHPADDPHTRKLRTLFQEAGIPPWMRRLCPLIHDARGHLLAVADLWQTDEGRALFARLGAIPAWRDKM